MRHVEFNLPASPLVLAGLVEDVGFWRAYVKEYRRNGTGSLQGATGATPQEAIDRATERLHEMMRLPKTEPRFNLDLSTLRK